MINKINNLIEKLNTYTKLYDEGHPAISDKEWDELYFELVNLEQQTGIYLPNSPTQKISYEVKNELTKVRHNHLMLSLDKTKDLNKVDDFLGEKDYIAMCKMDGLTCSLTYKNGKLVRAETRGNGEIGEDILHNALVIPSIPNKINYKNDLIVDGEIICTYEDFKEFETEYKNPRNFASGSIRLLDSKECSKRNLTFVAWDVIKGFEEKSTCNYLHYCLKELDKLGFTTVPYIACFDNLEEDVNIIKDIADKYSYPIDGVVFKFDNREYRETLGVTDHHFKNALAYKFYDEEYETTLLNIEWSMGRTGILTPIAIFEPIEIEGSLVSRASLHNISILKETLHGLGWKNQKIWVYKSNMIIPQISRAEENDEKTKLYFEIPYFCPICGEPTSIKKDNFSEMLYCNNKTCSGQLINRLDHFCGKKGLDIKGLSKATLEKLINWNWIEKINDLYLLKDRKQDWVKKPGFGEKSVSNILSAIEESKNKELWQFISALGIPLVGNTVAKEICKHFETYSDFIDAVEQKYDFTEWEGFGEEIYRSLITFDYSWSKVIYSIYFHLNNSLFASETNNTSLANLIFVVTGKLHDFKNRDELKNIIENLGGKVTGSISGKTNYLINNDKESSSAKNKKAQDLKIPIITEKEFIEKFLTN